MSVKPLASIVRKWRGFTLTAVIAAGLALLLVGALTSDSQRAAASPSAPQTADAFSLLVPGSGGNCAAPSNGGTVMVGCRFVLDLILNAGSNNSTSPGGGATGHLQFLSFTNDLIKVARVTTLGSTCTVTSTLAGDETIYDSVLQNETCNGPPHTGANCIFRGASVSAGLMSFGSGAVMNCPEGCPDPDFPNNPFRVARIGLCAVAPGQAVFHWQFAPPDPTSRDSIILNLAGDMIQNRALYTDYVINIAAPMLANHLTWQGRLAQPNVRQALPVTFTLKSGVTEVNYPTQNTDLNGNFTLDVSGLPAGTYNWRAKGPKFLAAGGTVVLTGGATTNLELDSLLVGDSNNDNLVNINDFTLMKTAFGTAIGDLSYDDRADLNGDLMVNLVDANQNKLNFGRAGAPPP